MIKKILCFCCFVFVLACANEENSTREEANLSQIDTLKQDTIAQLDTAFSEVVLPPPNLYYTQSELDSIFELHDTTWVDISKLSSNFIMDIRYATTNNFMELQIYDCPGCYLRKPIAKIFLEMSEELKETYNLRFKMFDCYRPSRAQWALWKDTPNPTYVADPRKGSMHSRGATADLTLVDSLGNDLDMGTPFDFFGKKAHTYYRKLPKEVLENRKILIGMMKKYGFKPANSEWWHYTYLKRRFKLSSWEWPCVSDTTKLQD
ncbi:MAG: M15 family metallopeptidase [Saprospiraceae bacterium]|nr:M15 family metallopeptidase [Saprospiraceae bacterium]